jgi:hypothetical protein
MGDFRGCRETVPPFRDGGRAGATPSRWPLAFPRLVEALAVNAIPLYGLVRDEWSLVTLLVVYWGENLLNTVFVGGRILLHRVVTRKRGHWTEQRTVTVTTRVGGETTTRVARGTTTLLVSFVTTNLLFALAHGIFVVAFVYGILKLGPSGPSLRRGLLGMLVAQSIGFVLDAVTIRTRSFAWIRQRADAALGRMVIVHLGLIGGVGLLIWTGRPASFFVVFVFLKLLFDLAAALPWKQELPTEAPGWLRKLGKLAPKPPGVTEEMWRKELEEGYRKEVEAQRRKQIEDEEPMPA